jgi:hypothetical protein
VPQHFTTPSKANHLTLGFAVLSPGYLTAIIPRSNYQNKPFFGSKSFLCTASAIMAGVAMIAEGVKL